MCKTFIIAEAGVNHNGSYDTAKKLINVAKDAGADAVKFQTWKTSLLMTKQTGLAEYQKINQSQTTTQYDMAKSLELSYPQFVCLKNYCDKNDIIFLSTPDEFDSANFLFDLQDIFKIGSGEITNLPFLQYIGGFKKRIILSTGMANIQEVENAVEVLINSGTKRDNITVLHCTSEYPAPMDEINLYAMRSISDRLKIKVGYSDHSLGIEVPIAAVALGATIIEKHFTLDRNMEGPDHFASLEPRDLSLMVKSIRNIEKAFGDGDKRPSKSEIKNIITTRKCIVCSKNIYRGEKFTEDNITTKRPAIGINPMNWNKVIGQKAKKDFVKDDPVEL